MAKLLRMPSSLIARNSNKDGVVPSLADIQAELLNHASELKQFRVARLWLFGSAARNEDEVNDLDFLVEFQSPPGLLDYMELKFLLERLFGLPVDLQSKASCPKRFYDRIEGDLKNVA